MHNIKLPFVFSELTVYMQNQLQASSFVETKVGFSHDVPFSLMHVLQKNGFDMTPLATRTSESGAISIIFGQAIHCFSNCIRAVQSNF